MKTFAALGRALGRALMTDLAMHADTLVTVYPVDQTHHDRWCRHQRTAATAPVRVPLADLTGGGLAVCPACEPGLLRHRGHDLYATTLQLLAAHEARAAVHRYLANPGRYQGTGLSTKHADTLARHLKDLAKLGAVHPTAAAHLTRLLDELAATRTELLAAQNGPALQTLVAERVHTQLVPHRLARTLRLDDTEVLVGLLGGNHLDTAVQEAVDAFTVAEVDRGGRLLRCPRFVADYLNRYVEHSRDWVASVQAVDAAGLTDADIDAIVSGWDVTGRTDRVTLRVVVDQVRSARHR